MLIAGFDPRLPFTRAEALDNGITASQLRGRGYRQLFQGCYVVAGADRDSVQRVRAALGLHPPGAFASHLSAARLYGLPVLHTPDEHVTVLRKSDRRLRDGVRSHVCSDETHVTMRHGLPVSCPADTFVALAPLLALVDLVAVGDAMVKSRLTTPEALVAAVAHSGQRGALRARRAAGFVRDGVDSPMETRLRMLIVLGGLPEPRVNHILRDLAGEWVARFDLSYLDYSVIVECDGRQHAEDASQWQHDLERRELLENAGWKLVVVTSKGIYREPEQTLERVSRALRLRGCRVPTTASQAWRPHFPVS